MILRPPADLFAFVRDQRKGLLDEIVALAELVDRLVDEVACDFVEAVRQVVQLFGVVAVVVKHVLQKRQSFLRRSGCGVRMRVAVRMGRAVRVSVRVAVSAVLVLVRAAVVVFVSLVLVIMCVFVTHRIPPEYRQCRFRCYSC